MPEIRHIDFYSHILGHHLKLEITGSWGYPVLMFPTSGGSYLQNRDFGLNGSVYHLVEQGKVKLYNISTLDLDNFYNDHIHPNARIYHYNQFVYFLVDELIPAIQRECNTHRIAVAGCSFGGYHAANLAFRFPDLVSHMISMSGIFSIRNYVRGSHSELVYFNCPEEFMPGEEAWKYHHMQIVLSTSDWDSCKPKNINMSKILGLKGIAHWYDEQKWIEHDWPLWRMVFPHFLGTFFG